MKIGCVRNIVVSGIHFRRLHCKRENSSYRDRERIISAERRNKSKYQWSANLSLRARNACMEQRKAHPACAIILVYIICIAYRLLVCQLN